MGSAGLLYAPGTGCYETLNCVIFLVQVVGKSYKVVDW